MAKTITKIFSCSKCGAQFPKWNGRCLECGGWGTLSEETVDWKAADKKKDNNTAPSALINLNEVEDSQEERMVTRIGEVDRVLGGGIVPGSLILISGEPGIGKSTIIAQIADAIARGAGGRETIYASGEESASQVKGRLQRLNCDLQKMRFLSATNVEGIAAAAKKEQPALLIVDSVQTVYSSAVVSEPGNISQIRAVTMKFLELAKENNIAVILVGHITKDGQVAGPKSLEHMVDTVIYLEAEEKHNLRILRATKNRFGSVNETGVFEMTSAGFKEVGNPSLIFIDSELTHSNGSAMSVMMEGTRPFIVEVQALVTKTVFGYPLRKTAGFDLNRLQVLSSVLTKRAGLNLSNQDIILNIVGGLKVNDPALDLAAAAAIISSFHDVNLEQKNIFVGEVGLSGEIRATTKLELRLREAEKLGYEKAFIGGTEVELKKIKVLKMKDLQSLVSTIVCNKKKLL